jgi:hypothetical protein
MTYDVYAMFSDGSYLVASGNNADFAATVAEKACKKINRWPSAFATLIRGEHKIRGPIFSFADLVAKS